MHCGKGDGSPRKKEKMLEHITWGQYLGASSVIIGGYYLIVGGLFYRQEAGALLKGKFLPEKTKIQLKNRNEAEEDEAFVELENVVMDIKYSVLEKAGINAGKEVILENLKDRLASYDGLRLSAYQIAVNDFIISNAKEMCGVAISEDELEEIWRSLPRN